MGTQAVLFEEVIRNEYNDFFARPQLTGVLHSIRPSKQLLFPCFSRLPIKSPVNLIFPNSENLSIFECN